MFGIGTASKRLRSPAEIRLALASLIDFINSQMHAYCLPTTDLVLRFNGISKFKGYSPARSSFACESVNHI